MCRLWRRLNADDDVTQPSTSPLSHHSDVISRPSSSGSGHVPSLIETLQPPPPGSPTLRTAGGSRSLMDVLRAQKTSAMLTSGQSSTLSGAVLGGVDLSLAAMVLGASTTSVTGSQSPAVSPSPVPRRQPAPDLRILVTTESPERAAAVTSPDRGAAQTTGATSRRLILCV